MKPMNKSVKPGCFARKKEVLEFDRSDRLIYINNDQLPNLPDVFNGSSEFFS